MNDEEQGYVAPDTVVPLFGDGNFDAIQVANPVKRASPCIEGQAQRSHAKEGVV